MTLNESNPQAEYQSFSEFYPFYLSQHANPICRVLHFMGSLTVLAILAAAITTGNFLWLLAMPVAGYGYAWVGHFVFEKNKPATFTYPLYSFIGDWVMFAHMLCGKVRIWGSTIESVKP